MKNRNIKNLILFGITALLISTICYLGVVCTTFTKLAKIEENNYLAEPENEVEEKTTNSSSNTNTTSSTKETEKSSNANLKMLGIRPTEYDFTGFKSGTTTYDVTVPQDVEEIEVYGTAQDSKAKVSGLGTKKIEEGLNDLSIVVTAEDGTEKIYTINLTRGGSGSSGEETEDDGAAVQNSGLSSLKIGDLQLTPEFNTTVYEYTAKYIGEEKTLNVEAKTTNEDYKVDIMGNDNLQEGENTITILVTDAKGKNIATYQVTVNKSLIDEEAVAREQEEARKKEEQKKMIIIGGAAGVIVLIIIIALIIRHRRNKAWAEDYEVPFSGLNNDDFTEDDEEEEEDYEDEVWSKEKARKQFLDDYDNNIYHDQERASKKKHKGKRFK